MDYFTMVEENFEGEYFVFTSLHADGFSAIAARQDVVLAARGVHASGPCTPITPPLKGVHAVDLPLQGRPFQTGSYGYCPSTILVVNLNTEAKK